MPSSITDTIFTHLRMRIHGTYNGMKSRCYTPSNHLFYRYGGRNIKICERWLDSTKVKTKGRPTRQGFLNFLEDMGPTWFEGATIDRIDNDGDYTPENCQWLSKSENSKKMNEEYVKNGTHHWIGNTSNAVTGGRNSNKNGKNVFSRFISAFDIDKGKRVLLSREDYEQYKGIRYFGNNSLIEKTYQRSN